MKWGAVHLPYVKIRRIPFWKSIILEYVVKNVVQSIYCSNWDWPEIQDKYIHFAGLFKKVSFKVLFPHMRKATKVGPLSQFQTACNFSRIAWRNKRIRGAHCKRIDRDCQIKVSSLRRMRKVLHIEWECAIIGLLQLFVFIPLRTTKLALDTLFS